MKKLIIVLFTLSYTIQLTASDRHFKRKIFYSILCNGPEKFSTLTTCPCCKPEEAKDDQLINCDAFFSFERRESDTTVNNNPDKLDAALKLALIPLEEKLAKLGLSWTAIQCYTSENYPEKKA